MYTTTCLLGGWCATFHTSIASEFCDEVCDLYIHSCDYLKKTSIKINVATDKGNTQNEIWHWTNNEIEVAVQNWLWVQVNSWSNNSVSRLKHLHGIQWLWVQIPLRPTFYSYFKESFSGEHHICSFCYTCHVITSRKLQWK